MSCTGTQYGNFEQTLFLGCSIVSFSASAGFGEQSTEVTVELVEDDCASPAGSSKTYWDLNLVKHTGVTGPNQGWQLADPGFAGDPDAGNLDIIGMPCYFRIADFELTGLIQSWEKTNNSSGKRYIVKLVSPVSILEHTKLIIGEYAGSVRPTNFTFPAIYSPHNLINIFGYAEAQGDLCPLYSQDPVGTYVAGDSGIDGATFGTPAGGFGGSLVNGNGMPWYMIKNLFNVLVNAFPIIITGISPIEYSPHGRITGKSLNISAVGTPFDNGFGLLSSDRTLNAAPIADYFVDLSEIPLVPTYFRFNQSEISLLEAITRVCQEAGHDFYIELLPIIDGAYLSSGSGITKIIKIRTVSRILPPPTFGHIQQFSDDAAASGILVGDSVGREFRNEINSKFVVGGLKQTLYQAFQNYDPEGDGQPVPNPEADDMILPYFGVHDNGNMIIPTLDASGDWEFTISSSSIESALTYATFSGLDITINELELRSAADQNMWMTYIIENNTHTNQALDSTEALLALPNLSGLYHRQVQFDPTFFKQPLDVREGVARDFNSLIGQAGAVLDPISIGIEDDTRKLYQFISSFATDYYGKKFSVRVPRSCVKLDIESNQISLSEEPTQDGGWTEQSNVLGIPLNNDALTFFRNTTNKIETIVAFTGFDTLDTSVLDPSSFAVYNNNLYLRGTVDSEYVYNDLSTYDTPRAVVEIPSVITSGLPANAEAGIVHGMLKLANVLSSGALDKALIRQAYENVGGKGIAGEFADRAFIPDGVAFGVRSNINTYGPWTNIGAVGGIEVEKNDGLVPWEYGGYTALNLAGQELAAANVTNMQVGEMGNISIVGYPTIPLGAELTALTALGGNQLVENRVPITGSYVGTFAGGTPFNQTFLLFNYGFSSSGIYGPTVTNINVNIGTEVTTQYQLRTYTPKFGRFARLNADRLKEVNQNRMKYVRDLRNYVRENAASKTNSALSNKRGISKQVNKLRQSILDRSLRTGTPHELFVGQIVNGGNGNKRTIISTSSFSELPTELNTGTVSFKSISTLDTIIRPVSLRGAGNLPRLITPLTPETGTVTGDGGAGPISQADLIPYINPLILEPTGLISRRYEHRLLGSGMGHDFDLVNRADYNVTGVYASGFELGLPSNGLSMHNIDGTYDYKHDYKTFALKGPLLLHSWGYDTDGNPVPNYMDTAIGITESGLYASSGLSGTFMSGFATRPDTWPVAPVDLRLNRQKGVWEAGGLATIVKCVATSSSSLSSQDFTADTVTFFQGSDATVTGTEAPITVENLFSWNVVPTLNVIAIKTPGNTTYTALQVECA